MPSVRPAPFSKRLMAMRYAGLAPTSDLLVVCGWELGKQSDWWPWRIVVPDDVDPLFLEFSVCRGLPCIVAAFNFECAVAVLSNVLAFYPTRLRCLDVTTCRLLDVYDSAARE